MKKLILSIFLCFSILASSQCYAAELLVKASPHWMDSLTEDEVDDLTDDQKEAYDARTQIGDIIVVRADNFTWGNSECLPDFIVIKIPGMSYDDAKEFEKSLWKGSDTNKKLKKRRKRRIDPNLIEVYKAQELSVVTIQNSGTVIDYLNDILEKT
jgi:phage pi2 protein 07